MTGGSRWSERAGSRGRWITIHGGLSGADLDAACAEMGVVVGRSRRRLWQRAGLFPLPAGLDPGAPTSGARSSGGYHHAAPALAVLVHSMVADGARSGGPEAAVRAFEAIRLLRLRARHHPGSEAGEERFYALVQETLGSLRARHPRRESDSPMDSGGTRRRGRADEASEPPRWATTAGSITARELEAACRARGVRLDRARRTYWQAQRVLPQPERRRLRPPEGNGGARGYYHPGVIDLACLIDYAVRADHPAKVEAWRCSARDLAFVLADWRAGVEPEAFYARVARLMPLVAEGGPIPGLVPRHRDVLPPGQRRLDERERQTALSATAEVAQAIVEAWVAEHTPEPVPERLVVWFRLERAGPERWRIAGAGARPTSHERNRSRDEAVLVEPARRG